MILSGKLIAFFVFRRLLLLAQLLSAVSDIFAIQFAPLQANENSECALLLDGPPRSSAFDYTFNLLRGNQL